MLLDDLRQALARAFGPGGEDHLLAARPQARDVVDGHLEDVDVLRLPLGREVAPALHVEVHHLRLEARVGDRVGREADGIGARDAPVQLVLCEVEFLRPERVVGHGVGAPLRDAASPAS